jgi:hypothetical protein
MTTWRHRRREDARLRAQHAREARQINLAVQRPGLSPMTALYRCGYCHGMTEAVSGLDYVRCSHCGQLDGSTLLARELINQALRKHETARRSWLARLFKKIVDIIKCRVY